MVYFLQMIFLILSGSGTQFFIFGSCSSFSLFSVCTLSNCTVIAGSWALAPHCPFHANKSTSSLTELQLTLTTGHFRCKREGEEGEKVSVSECRLAVLPGLSDLLSLLLLLLLLSMVLCLGEGQPSLTPNYYAGVFPKGRAS